jgi:hypothetical protein
MATKGMAPETSLIVCAIWCVSVVFLDQNWNKITDLRSAGQYVTAWRYAQLAFWVFILFFWIWNGWKGVHRYRADKG